MYENIQRGEYMIGTKVYYFRSKWEANFALYLEFLKSKGAIKQWWFEAEWFYFPFSYGTTRYLPDFKVEEPDGSFTYYEVKGFLTGKARTQLKRMTKYHPKIKLIIIEKGFMQNLKRNFAKLLDLY